MTPATGTKTLKIASFNTYLICNRFNQNRQTHPEKRASRIRRNFFVSPSKPLDLCFFQEVWGSGIRELTTNIPYSIPPGRSPWLHSLPSVLTKGTDGDEGFALLSFLRTIEEIIDTFSFHWQRTGGLYDLSRPSTTLCLYRKKHTFTVSRSKSKKGVECTLWEIPQWKTSDRIGLLLVFHTHLDPWHAIHRKQQIHEILEFMGDSMDRIENEIGKPDWSQTGVLVLGDFNIKAGSREYHESFMSDTKGSDVPSCEWVDYFAANKTLDQQHTYALENSLVDYPDDCGRIDYIFGIQTFTATGGGNHSTSQPETRSFLPLKAVSQSIFQEPVGEESSDHYALMLDLVPADHSV